MYFFKIPSDSLPFLQAMVNSGGVRSDLASMAMGRVIAQYMPLPNQEQADYGQYYDSMELDFVDGMLDTIHQVVPINFMRMKEYAKKFYVLRCNIALGSCCPSSTGTNGVYNVFHLGLELSKEDLGTLKKEGLKFGGYVSGFEKIFKSFADEATKSLV